MCFSLASSSSLVSLYIKKKLNLQGSATLQKYSMIKLRSGTFITVFYIMHIQYTGCNEQLFSIDN